MIVDATGVALEAPVAGPVVSLVPSHTETLIAVGAAGRLAGRTTYCVEPAGEVERVPTFGGTKNPDLAGIIAAGPALVVANHEENTPRAIGALRKAGVPVFVTYPRTVAEGIETVRVLGRLLGGAVHARATDLAGVLDAALATVRARAAARPPVRVFCPIWKSPWMPFSADTYAHDFLTACGGANVFAEGPRRYFPVTLEEVAARRPALALLPDEPYTFGPADAAEVEAALPGVPARLVSGRHLTWYGPAIGPGLAAIADTIEQSIAA
jgi:ABC-type Fe3+-hydroxamate transport system substrate-binding protein